MSQKFTIQVNAPGFDNSTLVAEQLIGFSFAESLSGCARFALKVETQNGRQFDSFVKNDETPFTLRFGTGENPDSGKQSRQKQLRLLFSSRKLIGNARAQFVFKGLCNGVVLNQHRAKDKHWKNRRISDIVEELIRDAGLQARVAQTEGKFTISGANLPTGKFISQCLLPLAYSQKGRDWRLWVEDGKTVHFEPTSPTGTVKITNMFRDGWVKLKSPRIIKDVRSQDADRSGKIEVVMYDADTDRLVRKEIGEGAGQFNYLGQGRPVERQDVSESIIVNMARDRQTDLQPDKLVRQVGQTIWGRKGRSLYQLVGICEFEPGVTVNQNATVDLTGPLGLQDVNTGQWVVSGVKHINSGGAVKTMIVCEKRWER